MEYVGGISGAALGYIHNNVAGALQGYQVGAQLGRNYVKKFPKRKEMAPAKRRASDIGLLTPASIRRRTLLSRRGSDVSMASSSRRSSISKASIKAGPRIPANRRLNYVSGIGAGAVTVTGNKKVVNRKKNVKVSKKLREKIKKVITGSKIIGMTQEISYGIIKLLGTEDNKQIVQDITTGNGPPTASQNPFFSNIKYLDAVSVLWNEKVQAEMKGLTDAGNFPAAKTKGKVLNCSVVYRFKNNTQRRVKLKLIEVYPKSRQVVGDPFAAWQAALAFQKQTSGTYADGPNQSGIFVSELYTGPGMLPDMKKLYTFVTKHVDMPAGTEYQHFIQGPKMQMFDLQKTWNGSLFQNYHKQACWLLACAHTDLVTTTLGTYGRYNAGGADENAYGVVFEATSRWKVEMPEVAGFIGPAATAPAATALGQRQFSYAYKTYPLAQSGDILSVNDENPTVPVADP